MSGPTSSCGCRPSLLLLPKLPPASLTQPSQHHHHNTITTPATTPSQHQPRHQHAQPWHHQSPLIRPFSCSLPDASHQAGCISCEEFRSAKVNIGKHVERHSSVFTILVALKQPFHSSWYNVAAVTQLARSTTSSSSMTPISPQTHAWYSPSTTTASPTPTTRHLTSAQSAASHSPTEPLSTSNPDLAAAALLHPAPNGGA